MRLNVMRPLASRLLLGLSLISVGCYDFHVTGPEDPPPVIPPALVDVTVLYRQPPECFSSSGCQDLVIFAASWMPLGQSMFLERASPHFWRGVARAVPVNFPPQDDPHLVVIYDPHLRDTENGGFTAARLQVGGQGLTLFINTGTPEERGFVYVDQNGRGHNP
jgi:hypothetical protein